MSNFSQLSKEERSKKTNDMIHSARQKLEAMKGRLRDKGIDVDQLSPSTIAAALPPEEREKANAIVQATVEKVHKEVEKELVEKGLKKPSKEASEQNKGIKRKRPTI